MIIAVADTQLPDDEDDGLWFETSDAHGVAIRDEDEYHGVRITLGAQLSTARMRLHVDVNAGDPIWPKPQTVQFPRLLGGDITLLGYPIPMVLAEKIVTASQRGITSTRWRDFADLYLIVGRNSTAQTLAALDLEGVADRRRCVEAAFGRPCSAHLPHLLSGPHEGETVAMWRLGLERWVNV